MLVMHFIIYNKCKTLLMANKGYFLQNLKSIKNEELPQYNGLFKYIKSLNYYLKHYF